MSNTNHLIKWPAGWAGDAGILLAGTLAGQAIPMLVQPWLRRTFTDADFGVFAVYFSWCSILSVSSSLRFEMGITSEKTALGAARLHALSQWVNLFFSMGLYLFFPLLMLPPVRQAVSPAVVPWLWAVPLSVLLMGAFRNLNMLLLHAGLFRLSAWNKVNRRFAEGVTQVIGGLSGFSGTLIVADMAGHVVNNLSAYTRLRPLLAKADVKLTTLKVVANSHKQLATVNALPSFLNTFCLMFPAIIIQQRFGDSVAGQYDLSRFVLAIPLALIGASVSQVVLQRTGALQDQLPALIKFYKQVIAALALMAVLMVATTLVGAHWLIALVFGSGWEMAAWMSIVLVGNYGLKLVVSPMSSALIGLGKLRPVAAWQWGYTLFMVGMAIFPFDGHSQFITVLAVGEGALYLLYAVIIYRGVRAATAPVR